MTEFSKELVKWDRLAQTWAETSPPAVPSADDINCFRLRLRNTGVDGTRCVVILGCTIELRRLFIDDPMLSTIELHCVDWSQKMYDRMTEIGKIDNPHELYHCEDWLTFHLSAHSVGAIIGDKVIDNVPFDRWPHLFNNFYRLLRPNGVLILHVGLVTHQFERISFEQALRNWAVLVDTGATSVQSAASGLWEDLLTGSAFIGDYDSHILSVSKFQQDIDEFRRSRNRHTPSTMAKVFDGLVAAFGTSFSDEWTAFTLEDINTVTRGMFTISGIKYSQDYSVAASQPIIELVRLA